MTTTPNPTAEQIVRATLLRCQFDTLGDKVADVVKDLRTHGLLSEGAPSISPDNEGESALSFYSEGAPSEEQVERARRNLFPVSGDTVTMHRHDPWTNARIRDMLTAAGVAPQEPQALDPEKVAEVERAPAAKAWQQGAEAQWRYGQRPRGGAIPTNPYREA